MGWRRASQAIARATIVAVGADETIRVEGPRAAVVALAVVDKLALLFVVVTDGRRIGVLWMRETLIAGL